MAKVSLSTMWGIGRFPTFREFVEAARGYGFSWVELNHQFPPAWLAELDRDGAGIGVSSVHDPCPNAPWSETGRLAFSFNIADTDESERATAVQITRASMDLAERVGAGAVVIHLGTTQRRGDQEAQLRRLYNDGQAASPEFAAIRDTLIAARKHHVGPALEQAHKSLREIAGYAADRGLRLGLENRQDYMELPGIDEMGVLLAEVDPRVVGYWYDVGHATILDRLSLVPHAEWLSRYSTRMVGAHLHDVRGVQDHHVPGVGDVDWALVAAGIPADALRIMELNTAGDPAAVANVLAFLGERGVLGPA